MVVLCGSSGVGKFIVAVLLERFYDVDSGCIFILVWLVSLVNNLGYLFFCNCYF